MVLVIGRFEKSRFHCKLWSSVQNFTEAVRFPVVKSVACFILFYFFFKLSDCLLISAIASVFHIYQSVLLIFSNASSLSFGPLS